MKEELLDDIKEIIINESNTNEHDNVDQNDNEKEKKDENLRATEEELKSFKSFEKPNKISSAKIALDENEIFEENKKFTYDHETEQLLKEKKKS